MKRRVMTEWELSWDDFGPLLWLKSLCSIGRDSVDHRGRLSNSNGATVQTGGSPVKTELMSAKPMGA
jgi:hypothetical protein